jgi:hypothetical protein
MKIASGTRAEECNSQLSSVKRGSICLKDFRSFFYFRTETEFCEQASHSRAKVT